MVSDKPDGEPKSRPAGRFSTARQYLAYAASDVRQVEVPVRWIVRNTMVNVALLALLGVFTPMTAFTWAVSTTAVLAVMFCCWLEAAAKFRYSIRYWKDGVPYQAWKFW